MESKKEKLLRQLTELLDESRRLTEDEVDESIHDARDAVLLELRRRVRSGEFEDTKVLVKLLNVLQPCVERYEMMHGSNDSGDEKIIKHVIKVEEWPQSNCPPCDDERE